MPAWYSMDDQNKIALAHQAEVMLNNDAFHAAVASYRQELLERFAAADSQPADWPSIHAQLQALGGLRDALGALMTGGQALQARRARMRTIAT